MLLLTSILFVYANVAYGFMLPTTKTTFANYEGRIESYTDWAFSTESSEAARIRSLFKQKLKNDNNSAQIRVLDVGCGPGRDMMEFMRWYPNSFVAGIDPSPRFCEIAAKLLSSQFEKDQYVIVEGDVSDKECVGKLVTDNELSLFDGAFCLCSLFHIPTSQLHNALHNIHSILRPNGVLFSSFPLKGSQQSVVQQAMKFSSGSESGHNSQQQQQHVAISEGSQMSDGRWCTDLTVDEHMQLLTMNGFRPLSEFTVRIYNGVWTGVLSEKI